MYYYGEFGYLNTIILNELTKYFVENPDSILEIETFNDYAIILNILFPGLCKLTPIHLDQERTFHGSNKENEIALVDFLKCSKYIRDYSFTNIETKIIKMDSNVNINKEYDKNTICIFPRNRISISNEKNNIDFQKRNMTKEMFDKVLEIIDDTFLTHDYKIIIVGKEILDTSEQYEKVEDINAMIDILSKCKLFVTCDSGMVDFAKNCGCKDILIVTNDGINEYHLKYNPNQTSQYFIHFKLHNTVPQFRFLFCYKHFMKKKPNLVTCVCPTYNRSKHLPNLCEVFNNQAYPECQRELIILDDSENDNTEIINKYNKGNIRYVRLTNKTKLGKKRNLLNQLADGTNIVCLDDDDYYPPSRIGHAIFKMTSSKTNICGSSVLHIYYSASPSIQKEIYEFGPYGKYHATNGTMAYNISYLLKHCYIDNAEKAEEGYFTNNFTEPLTQLDPFKTMLCIAHKTNTFDKGQIIKSGKKTNYKWKDFVKNTFALPS